ncbi:hypothetical protein [Mesorhizobium escarrei]|uniref:hypothetical protein n=1 Tax=Mesorhizobium escarrei TaxID=666018 RepID=UPI00345BA662
MLERFLDLASQRAEVSTSEMPIVDERDRLGVEFVPRQGIELSLALDDRDI